MTAYLRCWAIIGYVFSATSGVRRQQGTESDDFCLIHPVLIKHIPHVTEPVVYKAPQVMTKNVCDPHIFRRNGAGRMRTN